MSKRSASALRSAVKRSEITALLPLRLGVGKVLARGAADVAEDAAASPIGAGEDDIMRVSAPKVNEAFVVAGGAAAGVVVRG